MPKLIITRGDREGTAFDINAEAEIGRTSEARIRLRDTRVSRAHARIIESNVGWAIQDLGSTNGTFLNEKRVSQAALSHGDQIKIGGTEFLFLNTQESEPEPAPVPAPKPKKKKIDFGLPPPQKIKFDLPEPKTIQVKLKSGKSRRDKQK